MNTSVQAPSAPFATKSATVRTGTLRRLLLGSVAFSTGGVAASLMLAGPALANPTGGTVVAGGVSISAANPSTLNITQSTSSAIINWQSFGIAAGETTNFQLPNAQGVTLNRVTGNDPSAIFGHLTSNGTVFLVNPNGVFFGPHSKVDVAGIVATTANITDQNFLAGNYAFDQASANANASIVNEGNISIADQGLAALVAPSVRNSGVIQAKLGRVALGGANSFTLDFWGDGLLSFGAGSTVTTAPKTADGSPVKALVTNSGKIVADGGTVELTARTVKSVVDQSINTDGIIEAKSIGTHNGNIVLGGGDAGTVEVAGTLDASGTAAGATGGSIQVNGAAVNLTATASLDSSGSAGGGKIQIGTDGTKNAATVKIAKGAKVNASALAKGTGGSVTVMSDQSTDFGGTILSRGGVQGGDGGAAEVSSHGMVSLSGSVDLTAPLGKTGTLLIDPSALEITDTTSSVDTASQVSRGYLEGLSGTANITLTATGQITIDAMSSPIALATTAGNTFTIQSTIAGGITFLSSGTTITTAGGNIVLQAFGIGSTLSNIGNLSTSGGSVTLQATSNISLAGTINAGAGAISAQSVVGSISNTSGALLTGASVALSAAGGNVGDSTNAIKTMTTALTLETGGNLYVANTTDTLSSLAVTSGHVLPNGTDVFQVSSTGLTFAVADGTSDALTNIAQSGLNFSFTGDRSLALGTINVGGGSLSLTSTAGNLTGTAGTLLTAGALTLVADGSTTSNGAIGTSAQAIETAVSGLTATAGTGGVFVANTNSGVLALTKLTATSTSSVSTTGSLTLGTVATSGQTVTLQAGGNILDDGLSTTTVTANSLSLIAGGSIGATAPVTFTANTVSATATAGGIYAIASGGVTLSQILSTNGAISITTNGSTTATSLVSSTSNGSNSITLTVDSGSLTVGTINAGASGNVILSTLDANSGSITHTTGLVTGNVVTVSTPTTTSSDSVNLLTAASVLNVAAGNSIIITQTGPVTLTSLTTVGGSITFTDTSGAVTLGNISANSGNNSVAITATAGAILDDGSTSTLVSGSSVTLASGTGVLGTLAAHLETDTASLTLTSQGDIYLDNTVKSLTSLIITDQHATPGMANVLDITSPYLAFDVTDSGTQFALASILGTTLTTLKFTGDETIVAGKILASSGSAITLTATAGDILDDGNSQTRITGGSVILASSQGNLGASAAQALDVATTNLTVSTHGNLYVGSIDDLSNFTFTSVHGTPTANYTYVVTAPSLTFNLTDGSGGYAFNTLTDITGLNFSFSGDRTVTLGNVDMTRSGSFAVTSTGSILDDGNSATQVLANSVTLAAPGGSVGTSGTPLSIVTQVLSASAGAGGVYATIPMPTNSATNTVLVGGSTVGGPFIVTALEGDLQLNSNITVDGTQPVMLTASAGSITDPSGHYILSLGGLVDLTAANAIGATGAPVRYYSNAAVVNATATAGAVVITDLYGFQVGTISAGGAVALVSLNGSITDSTGATPIVGTSVTVAASGSVGSAATPLAVTSAGLALTAFGSIDVADTVALSSLALTSTGASSANSFAVTAPGLTLGLTDSGSQYYLASLGNGSSPLAFSFTGGHGIKLGSLDTEGGAASITATSGSIVADGTATTNITAPTVTLSAASGSIGVTGTGGAIALSGTTGLTLNASGNFYLADDTSLANLAITAGSSGATAFNFSLTAPDQTYTITDDGAYHEILTAVSTTGPALTSFSFTGNKNIEIGAITAGTVSLAVANDGTNGNAITMASGGTGIVASSGVTLSATSSYSDASLSDIGASGAHILVNTPSLTAKTTADLYVTDSQNLSTLALTVAHNTFNAAGTETDTPTYTYSVSDAGDLSLSIGSTGTAMSLSLGESGAIAFSLSADRALNLGTINAGSSSTGSVTLTSTGSYQSPTNSFPNPSVEGGSITAGTVSLSANNYQGDVGGSSTISVNTQNLAVVSAGNIGISDGTALSSLSITANHDKQANSYSYSITAPNLSSDSISYSNTYGLLLSNITATSALALTVNSDIGITLATINTDGGSVTLKSTGGVEGLTTGALITTDDLSLSGTSIGVFDDGIDPLDVAASSLAGTVNGSMILSNAGDLTFHDLTVTGSAKITLTAGGSFLSDGSSYVTAPTLDLIASGSGSTGGAIGTSAEPLLLNVRNLSTTTGQDLYVSDAVDLYSLNVTDDHLISGRTNILQVAAPQLTFNITDNSGGTEFDIANVTDVSGIDFSFTGDRNIEIGAINGQYGRAVYVNSTNGSLTQETSAEQITADSISLAATGSLGTSSNQIATNAISLSVSSGGNIYVDNSLDLSALSLTTTNPGSTAGIYSITSGPAFGSATPTLTFTAADDGTNLTVSNVTDTTGINFTVDAETHPLYIGTIDTAPNSTGIGGAATLYGYYGVFGSNSSNHVTAANLTLGAGEFNLGLSYDIGSSGTPLNISAPVLTLDITHSVYLHSDTHIDALSVDSTHPTASYGTYQITSPDLTYSASDSSSGTALGNITDTTGLAFSYLSDDPIITGTINLGTTGTVGLESTSSGGIVGDGNPAHVVTAASLSLYAPDGAVGGSGTPINADVNTISATADNGGVDLSLSGPASLNGFYATGDMTLDNSVGDISLGSIDLNFHNLTVDNTGGAILSGSLTDTRVVSLTANGSIGNISAITTNADGGTTTLTAIASLSSNPNSHGLTGSVNVNEAYTLDATSITGPGGITLTSGQGGLSVGTVNAGSSAVAITAGQGSITGDSTSNLITGNSVTLRADYSDVAYAIGTSGTAINVATPNLALYNQSNLYVADTSALSSLTIDRTGGELSSSGTISLSASGLSGVSISDSSIALSDSGLNLTFHADYSISVGALNVGSGGTVTLSATPFENEGSITAGSGALITAGSLTLTTQDYITSYSSIGSSGTFLPVSVGSITASGGQNGVYLTQLGSIDLSSISSGGALSVTTTGGGDITIGTLRYGNGQDLTLNAGGSIFAGGGTLFGGGSNSASTPVFGSINLTAVDGIGTAAAPIVISAPSGNAVFATVTGTGDIDLDSISSLPGGLTTSAAHGATNILSSGSLLLTSLTSGTDALGDDITVVASGGNITYAAVSAGVLTDSFDKVSLSALSGQVLASTSSSTVAAFAVDLYGANGVGNSTTAVTANGQRVDVTSEGGAIYLASTAATALAYVASDGGNITITPAADLLLANALSGGGTITVSGGSANTLTAGNINAGSGTVSLTDGTIIDDGLATTRIVGGTVTLTSANGIGTSSSSVQTTAGSLTATVSGAGGLFIDDNSAAGLTLTDLITSNGAITITAAGPLIATSVTSSTDNSADGISLSTSNGNLTLGSVTAGTSQGTVTVAATSGSILGSGSSANITAHDATLMGSAGIGTLTNLLTGAGTPIKLAVTTLDGLTTTAANSVISVSETGALTLGSGALSLATGGEAYIQTTGNLDDSAGLSLPANGSLALISGGTLTLPTSAFSTTGTLYLSGTTDVVVSGGGRTLTETAASLKFRSGSTGGDTTLDTTAGTIDAALSGAGNLVIDNSGVLTALTLATTNGNITVTNDSSFTATSVAAGGTSKTVSLTATTGSLTPVTVNAGSSGTIDLTASAGSIDGNATLTTATLNLVAGTAIGTVASPFTVNVSGFSAQVTGTGGIYVHDTGAVTLGTSSTNDGDIVITSVGTLTASNTITAGGGGNITLGSSGGSVLLSGTVTTTGTNPADGNLTVTGQTITVGTVDTVGSQSYTGTTTIGGDLTGAGISVTGNATLSGGDRTFDTSADNGTIAVSGTLNGGGHALTLTAGSGSVSLGGAATDLTTLTASGGSLAFDGVTTSGAQSYTGATSLDGSFQVTGSGNGFTLDGAATLAGATSVTTNGGAVAIDGTIDGAHGLTIIGNTTFGGAIGGSAALASLSVTGTAAINGGLVDTTGAQSYTGVATLGADTVLDATTASFGSTLDGAHALTITGNATFGAVVGGTAVLTSLDVTGAAAINGGTVTTTGSQAYGNGSSLGSNTTLTGTLVSFGTLDDATAGAETLAIDGNAAFGGAVGATKGLKSLSVTGSSTIDASIGTTGAQTYTGAVTLGGDATLAATAGAVGFASTVDGGHALAISGTGTSFAGAVGGNTALASLAVTGPVAINGGLVDTTGGQSYGSAVTLGADTDFGATTASFAGTLGGAHDVTITGNAAFGGAVTLISLDVSGGAAINGGTITTTGAQSYGNGSTLGANTTLTGTLVSFGTLDGARSLTIDGDALFGGAVGSTTALAALSVTGTSTIDADIATAGAQTYSDAVTLASDPVLTTNNAAVFFGSTVDGTELLTVSIGSGAVTFTEAVGGTTRLGALTVDSTGATIFDGVVKAASVTTDAGGTVAIDGGLVDTTGAQSYGDAVTLGTDTVLNATTASFGGTLNGAQKLAINGNGVFGGAVGGTAALTSLAVSGTSTLDANVTTVGAQTYNGAVTLGGNAVLTTTNAPVVFAATVDGTEALTITAGTGAVTFTGAVGGTTALGGLTVNSGGATTFDGTVTAASVTTDAAGTLALNGGSVTTTGAQSYGEAATLGADTTLNATNVSFGNTLDGAHALTIDGNETFADAVGGTAVLTSVTITGTTGINGGSVSTTGAQNYGGAVTLGADTALDATTASFGGTLDGAQNLAIAGNALFGGAVGSNAALKSLAIGGTSAVDANVTTVGAQTYARAVTLGGNAVLTTTNAPVLFAATVDGTEVLTVTAGTGAVTFTGAIGATNPLGALTVNSGGATIFDAPVTAASVTTDAAGTLALNGGSVTTTGAQSYGEAATLGADTVLNATTASFGGTLDGSHSLTVNGNAAFAGAVGGGAALTSLTVTGGAAINGGSVTTTGAESYGNGSTLGADTTLTGTLVSFTGSLDGTNAGAQGLSIAGIAAFDGVVGGNAALKSLGISGTTTLDGATITTAGSQSFGAAVLVTGPSALTSQNGSLGFASTIDATNRSGLTLSAVNGNITVAGAVGSTGALGALSVANVQNVTFGGAIDAASLNVTASGTPQFLGALFTDGTGGITLTGNSFNLLTPITATAGALTVNLGTGGTLSVGANAPVVTYGGFTETQTGTSTITLASDITSQNGPISFQGSPTLVGSALAFETNGLITFTGLAGASTNLTLNAGPTGDIVIGLPHTADPSQLAILKSLTVPLGGTGFATLYGTLGGDGGILPSSEVNSPLRGARYTYNTYPWGPLNLIGTITVTVPTITPSSTVNTGIGPNILNAGQAPSLLTVAGNNSVLGVGQSQQVLTTTGTNGTQGAVSGISEPDSGSSTNSGSKPTN